MFLHLGCRHTAALVWCAAIQYADLFRYGYHSHYVLRLSGASAVLALLINLIMLSQQYGMLMCGFHDFRIGAKVWNPQLGSAPGCTFSPWIGSLPVLTAAQHAVAGQYQRFTPYAVADTKPALCGEQGVCFRMVLHMHGGGPCDPLSAQ